MTKVELIGAVCEVSGVEKKEAESVLKAFTEIVTSELANKREVGIVGFGTFKTADRAAREGKNPSTGEPLQIAARTVPVFKPGKGLKEAVNK